MIGRRARVGRAFFETKDAKASERRSRGRLRLRASVLVAGLAGSPPAGACGGQDKCQCGQLGHNKTMTSIQPSAPEAGDIPFSYAKQFKNSEGMRAYGSDFRTRQYSMAAP